ncbi:AaceriADL205Cp [[Ashbya] aceris (nom. inval.)]|nr:AaceriADL205Cp [[Ashbya] aceris (nom. inval.)]
MVPTATVGSSTVNLIKTIVGAGLLAVPYAFRADGVCVAAVLVAVAAITSGFGLVVLAKASKALVNPRQSSFFALCQITYPRLAVVFDFAMFTQCFGVGVSYLIIVGDLFPGLLGGTREAWIAASAVVVVPLSHLRRFDSLKYSSVLGLVAIAYLAVMIVAAWVEGLATGFEHYDRGEVRWLRPANMREMVSTFSIIVFAFTGSMNMFSIINELGDNSMRSIQRVVYYSIAASTGLFILVGMAGYLTFGSNVAQNVILNFDPDAVTTQVGSLALGLMVLLSFPLLFHPGRIAFNNMVHWAYVTYGGYRPLKSEEQPADAGASICLEVEDEEDRLILSAEGSESYQSLPRGSQSNEDSGSQAEVDRHIVPFEGPRFYIVTWLLLLTLYLVAFYVHSFAYVLALVGATGSTAISFTLPGLFGYKLIGTDSLMKGNMLSRRDYLYRCASLGLVGYGVVVTIVSLLVVVYFGI